MQTQVHASNGKEPVQDTSFLDMVVFALARETHGKANAHPRAPHPKARAKRFSFTAKHYGVAVCFRVIFAGATLLCRAAKSGSQVL